MSAIDDYDEAIRLRPDYPRAYLKRADALDRMGDREGAIQDLEQAVRLAPESSWAETARQEAQRLREWLSEREE